MNAPVSPERLLKQLDEYWISMGKSETSSSEGVLRACSMTLVILLEGNGNASMMLADLMSEHPARAIVVRVKPDLATPVKAEVTAFCRPAFGSKQQICCEMIEITVHAAHLSQAAALIRALTVPDLPVMVYCRTPALLIQAGLEEVFGLAGKIIADSSSMERYEPLLATLATYREAGRQVADLAWTRLTRWREMIAQVFDDPCCCDRAGDIGGVSIEWEGVHVPSSAFYMATWIEQTLGRRLDFRLVRAGDCDHARIKSVRLSGSGLDISVTVDQTRAAEIVAPSHGRHTVLPRLKEDELLREELSISCHDPVYDEVLRRMPELLLRTPETHK